ncbi:MAG TPA: THxN family PEP-CTERM protein [Pedomonas sp.]|uniref:THxN family PEP-CTERM protein n=1 Tax=Pedomonas sp. TaxID=2976421 RepID=UPI002F3F1D2E
MKSLASSIALAATVALSSGAVAAPISEWAFTVNQSFDPNSTTWTSTGTTPVDAFGNNVDALPDGQDPAGNYSYVRWGTPANPTNDRSFLAADTNFTQTGLMTNGAGVAGSTFYHGNYTVWGGSQYEAKLNSASLFTEIEISSVSPEGLSAVLSRTFEIGFVETTNDRNGIDVPIEQCDGYDIWGGSGNIASCPDRFSLDIRSLDFSTEIDGYIYDFTVAFDLSTLNNIVGVDVNDNIATIWTGEGVLSSIGTLVTVTAREVAPVPEPASIALLGGGLLAAGMGLRRRRK